ncbi:MAG: biopolymer transporter ExbD [Bdellovibrionales bacterium]|nr:biopolymer transporter ExbD [Bdellovibrionales bacterium]
MAGKIGGGDDQPIAEINIVPFVDIILVVLIIFMVTTPFIMKPSLNVQLPEAGSGEETAPSKFSISISKSGEYALNGEPMSVEDIKKQAQTQSADNPNIQAIISADKDVPHGNVVSAIDAVKSGGIKRFAITIEKKK